MENISIQLPLNFWKYLYIYIYLYTSLQCCNKKDYITDKFDYDRRGLECAVIIWEDRCYEGYSRIEHLIKQNFIYRKENSHQNFNGGYLRALTVGDQYFSYYVELCAMGLYVYVTLKKQYSYLQFERRLFLAFFLKTKADFQFFASFLDVRSNVVSESIMA